MTNSPKPPLDLTKLNHGQKRLWQLPACTQIVKTGFGRALGATRQCRGKAYFRVNGSLLCERHAGQAVLAALLGEQAATPETKDVGKQEEG